MGKKEGDKVASGDVLCEIETDKATMEVEAVDEGILGRILVPDGTENVAVNAPIALLLAEGEDASALDAAMAAPGEGGRGAGGVDRVRHPPRRRRRRSWRSPLRRRSRNTPDRRRR